MACCFVCYSARRTKVIDDESDYYATDSKWLGKTEREELEKKRKAQHAKKHASRRDKKITFDFAGNTLLRLYPFTHRVGVVGTVPSCEMLCH